MDLDRLRQELISDFCGGPFPAPVPLNTRILSKRVFHTYEEWKIEYDVETEETMPVEPGRSVPAYLLIPRNAFDKPAPAMVCFHQCGEDCAVGKEAVVGKVPQSVTGRNSFFDSEGQITIDRRDQAYGYELVHQGFVVLAPDSINCGERNIEAIRKPGEIKICHRIIGPHIGREDQAKRITDAMRAVDLLQSLGFVDPDRIGGIGHSMGSDDVYWLMAFDDRVKAGVMNPGLMTGVAGRFVPLLVPRLYIGSWLLHDHFDSLEEWQQAYDFTTSCYEDGEASENLHIHKIQCGHRFVDEFKWKAYKLLKEHFGLMPEREILSLHTIVEEAKQSIREVWDGHGKLETPKLDQDCFIRANRERVTSALSGLFLYLLGKQFETQVIVETGVDRGRSVLKCLIPCQDPIQTDASEVSEETLRGVEQVLADYDATLTHDLTGHEIRYYVSFPSIAAT